MWRIKNVRKSKKCPHVPELPHTTIRRQSARPPWGWCTSPHWRQHSWSEGKLALTFRLSNDILEYLFLWCRNCSSADPDTVRHGGELPFLKAEPHQAREEEDEALMELKFLCLTNYVEKLKKVLTDIVGSLMNDRPTDHVQEFFSASFVV